MVSVSKQQANLPERQSLETCPPLALTDSFRFHCHPGVSCFRECCRELDLSLSPYDVLRLRRNLAISSQEFLDHYAVVEFGPEDYYPKVFLAMIDDGRASCPFIGPEGCRVYADRPGACRIYPLGRGVSFAQGEGKEQFITLHEGHCHGFEEEQRQTVDDWQRDQQLTAYNQCNDQLIPLFTKKMGQERRLTDAEGQLFIDTLYTLELFQKRSKGEKPQTQPSLNDEELLLSQAINWLQGQW